MSSKLILKNQDGSISAIDLLCVHRDWSDRITVEKKDRYVFMDNLMSPLVVNDIKSRLDSGKDVTVNDVLFIDKSVHMSRDIIRRKYSLAKNINRANYAVVDTSRIKPVYYRPNHIFYMPSLNKAIIEIGHNFSKSQTYQSMVCEMVKNNTDVLAFVGNTVPFVDDIYKRGCECWDGLDMSILKVFLKEDTIRTVDINDVDMSIDGNDITLDNLDMIVATKSKQRRYTTNEECDDAVIQIEALNSLNWEKSKGTISRLFRYMKGIAANYYKVFSYVSYQPTAIRHMIEVCSNDRDFVDAADLKLFQDWLSKIINVNIEKGVSDINSIFSLMQKHSIPFDMFTSAFDNRVLLKRRTFVEKEDETVQEGE